MSKDLGALSGSRASTEPCGLGPPGFDPERLRKLGSQISFLRTMVDIEIGRCGEFESFLVRVGLLRDILHFAASAIEARSDATGTGAAEGESAVPERQTPNPIPKDRHDPINRVR